MLVIRSLVIRSLVIRLLTVYNKNKNNTSFLLVLFSVIQLSGWRLVGVCKAPIITFADKLNLDVNDFFFAFAQKIDNGFAVGVGG